MTTDRPASPPRPQLAVSASIFKGHEVLLVRRNRQPGKGFYTLPGGRVEYGESLIDAIKREVSEETGLMIEVLGLAGWREVLPPMANQAGHFVIMSFATRWTAGNVVLNDELDDAQWRTLDNIGDLRTTEGLADVIGAARGLIGT
jgi:ADP-ribose pyrophosphatase YjhB (NUDIX family)